MPDVVETQHTAPPHVDPGPPDRAATRMALVVGGLIIALIGGFGIGRTVGMEAAPARTGSTSGTGGTEAGAAGGRGDGHNHAGASGGGSTDAGGLAVSAGGYTLVPETTSFPAGTAQPFTFRVQGPDGKPVTGYQVAHEKLLHLIVVRRDLTGFQHLHPDLGRDGTWTVPLTLPAPGSYRAYADFVVPGTDPATPVSATLAVDLTVPGDYRPDPPAAPSRTSVAGGYTVALEGAPRVGATQPLLARVTGPQGDPVLERYLGSYGHLVIIRDGDLAYVHVHPEADLAGGAVRFWVAAPSPGRYRAFLDFQVAGTVHTASFTLAVQ